MRDAKELLVASKEFASEIRWLSWWHFWTTLAAFAGLIAVAVGDFHIAVRVVASTLAGLASVRIFILYHDYQHGAILADSLVAKALMSLYGVIALNPPSVWNRSHDHHHKHNSKTFGANIGSYPVMTKEAYATASRLERVGYSIARHPITMLLGYLSVFFWGMSLRPFLQSPKRHWDGALGILLHFALVYYLWTISAELMLLGMVWPLFVASSFGAYLFYAQHNYPAAKLRRNAQWSHVEAALNSSCYIEMDPVMNWFTGNIGYHHIHHLNARIPFYRLPEAMNALEELQSPGTTTLRPRDIAACLRLKLWDQQADKFVSFDGG